MTIQITGVLDIFVLKKANEKNITGQMVIDKIEKLTEENWKPSPGTIYPLLAKLTAKEFLKKKKEGKRNYYKITSKGKRKLKKEMNYITDDFAMMICNMSPVFAYLYGIKAPKGLIETKKKWFIYLMKNPNKWQQFIDGLGKKSSKKNKSRRFGIFDKIKD